MNRYTKFDTLVTTGLWKNLVFEILISVVAYYPFISEMKYREFVSEYDTYIEYEINDLLLVLMFMRLYITIRFMFYLSEFLNPRTHRVCSINGCESNSMFAVKGLMKQKSYPIIFSSLLLSLIIFGYWLRIFESPMVIHSG